MSCTLAPQLYSLNESNASAHGRMVTSSRQITKVKQRRAQLVLGWVTAARVTLPAMCRGVGQASHNHAASVHPAVMGTWWNEKAAL